MFKFFVAVTAGYLGYKAGARAVYYSAQGVSRSRKRRRK